MFSKLYDFKETPTEKEIKAVRDAIASIKGFAYNATIQEILAAKWPGAAPEHLSRCVYVARKIIDAQGQEAAGFFRLNAAKIQELEKSLVPIVVKTESILVSSLLMLKPKQDLKGVIWMKKGARSRGWRLMSFFDSWAKLA